MKCFYRAGDGEWKEGGMHNRGNGPQDVLFSTYKDGVFTDHVRLINPSYLWNDRGLRVTGFVPLAGYNHYQIETVEVAFHEKDAFESHRTDFSVSGKNYGIGFP